jgi:AbrB family looped-hinge helix DNA binding protein
MEISIDIAGRLVIPKAIRDEAGLEPGMTLEIRCRDGRVEIERPARAVRIVSRGKLRVAVPVDKSDPLSAKAVRETQLALRRSR